MFTHLVIKGSQESHLRIRQLVDQNTGISTATTTAQDYVAKVTQLCVLPDAIVHIFTHLPEKSQISALKFLEVG